MIVQRQLTQPDLLRIAAARSGPWATLVQGQHQHPWHRRVASALRQPIHATLTSARITPWPLRVRLQKQRSFPYAPSDRRATQHTFAHALLDHNPARRALRMRWDLAPALGPLQPQTTTTLTGPMGAMELLAAELTCVENDGLWLARLTLARHGDFLALRLGDALNLTLGNETFALRVTARQVERTAPAQMALRVDAASPAVVFEAPLAAPMRRRWDAPVLASAVVDEALAGMAPEWAMLDWSLRPGRLDATDWTPWQCARTLVQSGGGILESRPDGSLRVRPRFPVALSLWHDASPDHVFSDATDHLEMKETLEESPCWQQVTVRERREGGSALYLDMTLDERPEGFNHGIKRFYAGETAHLLIAAGPGVTPATPTASAGTLHAGSVGELPFQETLAFSADGLARLSRPATRLKSTLWFGVNLGVLTLDPDGRLLRASIPGPAVARITYWSRVQSYALQAPLWNDDSVYPICVHTQASNPTGDSLRVTVRRSDGHDTPAEIVAPLLSDTRALRQRAEMELDASRLARRLEITALHRSGLQPGQLVEIHDALHGASFRGHVHQVRHHAADGRALTLFTLLTPR